MERKEQIGAIVRKLDLLWIAVILALVIFANLACNVSRADVVIKRLNCEQTKDFIERSNKSIETDKVRIRAEEDDPVYQLMLAVQATALKAAAKSAEEWVGENCQSTEKKI